MIWRTIRRKHLDDRCQRFWGMAAVVLESILAGLTMGAGFAWLQKVVPILYKLGVMPFFALVFFIVTVVGQGWADGAIWLVFYFVGYGIGFGFFKPWNRYRNRF